MSWFSSSWFGIGAATVTTVYVDLNKGLIDAVNRALVSVKDAPLASLDDDTDTARAAKGLALDLLDECLQVTYWNFATRRAALDKLATGPEFGPHDAFMLPPDPLCLQVQRTNLHTQDAYSIELNAAGQRVLLTTAAAVSIVYTARIANPALWSPAFRAWYVARLAHELCYGVTAKGDLAKMLWDKSEVLRKKALALDGQEGRRNESISTDLLVRNR